MSKIITMDDLIDYLKIPDFTQKVDQEIIIIKITQEQDFQEETMLLKDFPRENKEVSISQRFFMDANNVGYYKQVLLGDVYYKNISYDTDERVFTDADFQEPLVEVSIPEKIYNGGFQFFINPNNQLVGLVEVVHADNSKDYISFNPGDFSLFNENTYHYTNVYGVKVNENLGISVASLSASVHRFPILSKLLGDSNPYQLSYYYKKDANKMLPSFLLDEDEIPMIALRISFKTLSGVLSFLKETIFNYYNEVNDFRSKWRHRFLERLGYHITPVANKSSLNDKKALIYQIPEALYHVFYNNSSLWAVVQTLASGNITNVLGTNEEDLLLKLLKILYHRYTHKYNNKQDVGRKVVEEKELVYVREQNDTYLKKLLTIKTDNNTLLQKLVNGLDGEQFQTYIYFIWSIWKNSSYANINPETNKLIEITDESPVILAYKSNKVLGFHSDNATINWETEKAKIEFKVRVKVGTKEEPEIINVGYGEEKSRLIEASRDIYETFTYNYHPFSPIVVLNSETPGFILKEQSQEEGSLYTKLPAFLLYANGQTAFWKNVFTGVEYALDILSTVSGVGNLIKVGRLLRVLNKSKALIGKTKQLTLAITAVKAVTGVVEVSTGTVNTLLKLTNVNDTELGKNISKYLFYLEMACLAGEVSVFLKGKLSKTAKTIIENPKLLESLDDLVRNEKISELEEFKFYEELFTVYRQYIEDLKVLGIVPKLTHAAEKAFLKGLKKVFYNKYKVYLYTLKEELVIAEKWKKTINIKPLVKSEIDELLDLRKLKNGAFNKNTAKMEVDLLINGEKITLKYKAIAGKGQSTEGLVKSANREDLIREMKLKSNDELISYFKATDKQTGELKPRFQDSEVKILNTFDNDLAVFQVKYGIDNIKVERMRLNTLYEPCMSCKKQFIIRLEIYKVKQIEVKAVILNNSEFAQGNEDLRKLGIIID